MAEFFFNVGLVLLAVLMTFSWWITAVGFTEVQKSGDKAGIAILGAFFLVAVLSTAGLLTLLI
ncbi:hypothetical protein AU152_gp34 [Mycobacterium phage Phlei]|uniref:Uncharacterized protein n=1 Tax=Mycobacterium phage Phlei TaxID=1690684 RepID=A0A0N9BDM6_9CAUD|nr:hypothetical protein AU152_gp34 [Mycobacterium phage Phlei]ALA48147.1 hypothetical protein [Mycobacterium phage Phlei]